MSSIISSERAGLSAMENFIDRALTVSESERDVLAGELRLPGGGLSEVGQQFRSTHGDLFNLLFAQLAASGSTAAAQRSVSIYREERSEAMCSLGSRYERGSNLERNIRRAFQLYRLAAIQGCLPALCHLGRFCGQGIGIKSNVRMAFQLYRVAADRGYAPAQFCLGRMYDYGIGVKKNYPEAEQLYRLAAEQGYAPGQSALGFLCEIDGDDSAAVRLYRLAADQGYAKAQYLLGVAHEEGFGLVEVNQLEAVRLYSLAANQGDTDAKIRLACAYASGLGVVQDVRKAVDLYRLSTGKQGQHGCEFDPLDELESFRAQDPS